MNDNFHHKKHVVELVLDLKKSGLTSLLLYNQKNDFFLLHLTDILILFMFFVLDFFFKYFFLLLFSLYIIFTMTIQHLCVVLKTATDPIQVF